MILLGNQTYKRRSALGPFLPALLILVLVVTLWFTVNWGYLAQLDFRVIWEYRMPLIDGLVTTIWITLLSLAIGTVAGAFFAILLQVGPWPLRTLIQVYVEVFRNIPLIVQIFWVHFSLPALTGISTTALLSGCIAISLQAAAYLTDIARGGIRSVPRGQFEAAESIGMTSFDKWVFIVIPQAAKLMMGPLLIVTLSFFKATSILGVLSIGELLKEGVRVADFSFQPIEVLTAVALTYFVVGYTITRIAGRIERKY